MSESQNREWKRSWHDDYLKWICGFANAVGGTIYIGKDDDGVLTHLENHKALMESLPNKIRENLGIICDVNLHDEAGKKYIEIRVNPYSVPVSLRGRYYYRSGSSKMEMTGNTLNEFLLKKAGKTWDDVIEEGAGLDDIDDNSIKTFVKDALKSGRMPNDIGELSTVELLEKIRLLDHGKLKRAAIILFGKDPNRFYYRSEHYNFAKKGIPIIFFFNGIHADYHKPTDTIEKIRFDILKLRSRLIFFTAWEIANRPERIQVD